MKKITLILAIVVSFSSIAISQEGKPFVKVFANYNSSMEEDYAEFEIKRTYLGYSYRFTDDFSAKVTLDVGKNSGGSEYTAFLKIASLNWKASDQLSIDLGMIGAKNFKFMEKAWGKRYIEKSALDKNKWASAADAGISGTFRVSDMISLDAQILNGEGYKSTQSDGLFRTGAGATIDLNDKISARVFIDKLPTTDTLVVYPMPDGLTDVVHTAEQTITSAALVYTQGDYNIGIEKSIMENEMNANNEGLKREIVSMYGSMDVGKFTIFLRRDILSSNIDDMDWEGSNLYWAMDSASELIQVGDGVFQLIGVEREITKGLKMSINMQTSQAKTLEGAPEAEEIGTFYVNLEYKF